MNYLGAPRRDVLRLPVAAPAEVLGLAPDTVSLVSGDVGIGGLSIVRVRLGAGREGAPPHRHQGMHELFHVLDGDVDVLLGDDVATLSAGDTLLVEPTVVHAFAAGPDRPVDLLVAASPGAGRGDYFRLLDRVRRGHRSRHELLATGARFDNAFTHSDAWTTHRAAA